MVSRASFGKLHICPRNHCIHGAGREHREVDPVDDRHTREMNSAASAVRRAGNSLRRVEQFFQALLSGGACNSFFSSRPRASCAGPQITQTSSGLEANRLASLALSRRVKLGLLKALYLVRQGRCGFRLPRSHPLVGTKLADPGPVVLGFRGHCSPYSREPGGEILPGHSILSK